MRWPLAWRKVLRPDWTRSDAIGTDPLLATYSYMASARADFLRKLGRTGEARMAYEEALLLSENVVERAFLEERIGDITS